MIISNLTKQECYHQQIDTVRYDKMYCNSYVGFISLRINCYYKISYCIGTVWQNFVP